MSRGSTLILLGILTILMPFSGLPVAARTFFTIIFGACVIGIGASIRTRDTRAAHTPVQPPLEAPNEISSI